VPESLVAEGRLGFAPGEEIEDIQALTEERLAAVAARDPWLRDHPPTVEWFGGQFGSAEVPLDDPLCDAVRAAHEAATGTEVAVEGVPYGADMRLFILFGGMPCVMYGAGDVDVLHAPDEFIALDDLLTATKTVAILLAQWCGFADRHP
jgi:acetylornithine deacetylase